MIDRDPAVLRSFERTFETSGCTTFLASSTHEAMAILASRRIDILFADVLTEPGGMAFLIDIREKFPDTVRVVLSAINDRNHLAKIAASGTAELCLLKPWIPAELVAVAKRLLAVYSKIRDKKLTATLSGFRSSTVMPDLYRRISAAIANDRPASEIASMMAEQPDVAARVLSLANRSLYGAEIGTVLGAIVYLGLDIVKNIVLAAELFSSGSNKSVAVAIRKISDHAECVCATTAGLHRVMFGKSVSPAHATAGLFLDMGRLMLLNVAGNVYSDYVTGDSIVDTKHLVQIEEKNFGVGNPVAGAVVLDWWQMPAQFSEAVLNRFSPDSAGLIPQNVMAILHIADAHAWRVIDKMKSEISPGALATLGISEVDVSNLIETACHD